MKTAIIFSSSHGTTEKAAQELKEKLNCDADIIDLKKNYAPDLTKFDTVILGSSVHAGSIQPKIKQFIAQKQSVLVTKRLGLFICCMLEGEKAQKQFETVYPKELREASSSNGLFGGEYIFSKMNFFEKIIIKKISGVTSDMSKLDHDAIYKFAGRFNLP